MPNASANSLKKVNKKIAMSRGGLRSQVNLGVLIAWLGLLAFGTLVMWSASFSNPEVSFSRHLLGIGLGIFVAVVIWNLDLSNLANISTVLLVADIIIFFLP